jgi:hypothetical protein
MRRRKLPYAVGARSSVMMPEAMLAIAVSAFSDRGSSIISTVASCSEKDLLSARIWRR